MHGMEKVLGEARQACRAWQRNTDTESLDKDSGCVCNERNQLRSFANLSEKKKEFDGCRLMSMYECGISIYPEIHSCPLDDGDYANQ